MHIGSKRCCAVSTSMNVLRAQTGCWPQTRVLLGKAVCRMLRPTHQHQVQKTCPQSLQPALRPSAAQHQWRAGVLRCLPGVAPWCAVPQSPAGTAAAAATAAAPPAAAPAGQQVCWPVQQPPSCCCLAVLATRWPGACRGCAAAAPPHPAIHTATGSSMAAASFKKQQAQHWAGTVAGHHC